jgi:GNAT superfamily N-acetyltransferase
MTGPIVRLATAAEVQGLEALWRDLYAHQAEHGMLLRLPDGAFDAWLKSIEPLLGRFAAVVIAIADDRIVGFVAGRTRMLPPYFGIGHVGAISEVFVSPEARRLGIGRVMLTHMVDWYRAQGIQRIELQVVARNPEAVTFYERLGWTQELVQMVLQDRSNG